MAMRAKSETGKTSDISNIVEVFVSDTEQITTEENKETKISSPSKETVGIVIGVVLAVIVLIIIIYLVVYFLFLKPKRKEEKKERRNPEVRKQTSATENNVQNSSSSNHVNSINYIPADAIIKNHREIQQAKAQNKAPPVFKEEDFVDRNSSASNESGDTAEPGYSQVRKTPKDKEPLPPKSPKRTTCV